MKEPFNNEDPDTPPVTEPKTKYEVAKDIVDKFILDKAAEET